MSLAPARRVLPALPAGSPLKVPWLPARNLQDPFLKVLQQPTWIRLPHETPLSALLEPLVGRYAVPFFRWTCASVVSCCGTCVTDVPQTCSHVFSPRAWARPDSCLRHPLNLFLGEQTSRWGDFSPWECTLPWSLAMPAGPRRLQRPADGGRDGQSCLSAPLVPPAGGCITPVRRSASCESLGQGPPSCRMTSPELIPLQRSYFQNGCILRFHVDVNLGRCPGSGGRSGQQDSRKLPGEPKMHVQSWLPLAKWGGEEVNLPTGQSAGCWEASWGATLTRAKDWKAWGSRGRQSTALGLWVGGWGPLVTRASCCPTPSCGPPDGTPAILSGMSALVLPGVNMFSELACFP